MSDVFHFKLNSSIYIYVPTFMILALILNSDLDKTPNQEGGGDFNEDKKVLLMLPLKIITILTKFREKRVNNAPPPRLWCLLLV